MLTLCVIVLLPYARACWRYSGCEEGELVDWEKEWMGISGWKAISCISICVYMYAFWGRR